MLYFKGIILFFQSSEWHSLDIVHGDERKGKVIYRRVASLKKKKTSNFKVEDNSLVNTRRSSETSVLGNSS